MKRNIISSKVEPQNTEDLWLNLVDGNIYSYEYGTWTNINNVPNRVFNLDIDYTEENLTKFLSPLYEEGFSKDDFSKKVYDKWYETNSSFKLEGEEENIRINVSLKDTKRVLKPIIGYYMVGYIDASEVIDWPSRSSNQTFVSILELDLTIGDMGQIYNVTLLNDNLTNIFIGYHDEIIGEAYDPYKLDFAKLCSALGRDFDPNKKYTVIHTAGNGNDAWEGDVNRFGLPMYDIVEGKANIASADIKLRSVIPDSQVNQNDFSYNKQDIQYVSGITSNKLDFNKMKLYLGTDIKHLLPAKIDLLLPYDAGLYDLFPIIVNNITKPYNMFYPYINEFFYIGLNMFPMQYMGDLYNKYAQLCAPIELGIYKDKIDKTWTPIDTYVNTFSQERIQNVYVNMNVKRLGGPDYWFDLTDKSYGVPKYYTDSTIKFNYGCYVQSYPGMSYRSFRLLIYDLNIGIELSLYNDIYIYSFTPDIDPMADNVVDSLSPSSIKWQSVNKYNISWREAIKFLQDEYGINEETIYKKIVVMTDDVSVKDGPIWIYPQDQLSFIQFVGADYENASPNIITFEDLGISIIYQASRYETKKCHILDHKTGVEYTLQDLGYHDSIWLPKNIIMDSSNDHHTSSYMLAVDFESILNRFNILNRQHKSILVTLDDGPYFADYLGTNYIFNVVKAEDFNRKEIVKLISEVVYPYNTGNIDPDTNILYPFSDFASLDPAHITHEFYKELKREGLPVESFDYI